MAFMGRGDMPSLNNNSSNMNDGTKYNHYNDNLYYRRYYYYIPLDNTYVLMQMITTFIILIFGVIAFITTYKSTIIDPIEHMKKLFINIHLISIGILLAITLISNYFSKNVTVLIKRLGITFIISITIMLVFLGIRFNLDKTYTKLKFEQFYSEQNISENSNKKSKLDLSFTGVNIKSDQEYYIDECMKLYNIFKSKTYGILGIHLLLNILLIYQISKILKLQAKKDKINKDDLILFDEEQNVRF